MHFVAYAVAHMESRAYVYKFSIFCHIHIRIPLIRNIDLIVLTIYWKFCQNYSLRQLSTNLSNICPTDKWHVSLHCNILCCMTGITELL